MALCVSHNLYILRINCNVLHLDVAPVYDLFAVLIHRGPSASSGHYIAVIKDPVTGATYKFNDTEVEKEKKFSLANEEDSGNDLFHTGRCRVVRVRLITESCTSVDEVLLYHLFFYNLLLPCVDDNSI